MQELLRIKNQLIFRDGGDNHGFGVDFVFLFGDDDGDFSELVGAHVAVVEEKGFFWGEEMEHVVCGLVVKDAVAAELKVFKINSLGGVVGDGVFEVKLYGELPVLFGLVLLQKIG